VPPPRQAETAALPASAGHHGHNDPSCSSRKSSAWDTCADICGTCGASGCVSALVDFRFFCIAVGFAVGWADAFLFRLPAARLAAVSAFDASETPSAPAAACSCSSWSEFEFNNMCCGNITHVVECRNVTDCIYARAECCDTLALQLHTYPTAPPACSNAICVRVPVLGLVIPFVVQMHKGALYVLHLLDSDLQPLADVMRLLQRHGLW